MSWHKQWGRQGDDGVKDANADFETALCTRFAEAIDINRENNKAKGERLHRARASMIWALVFVGLVFLPYFAQTIRIDTPPSLVRLEEPVGVLLEESRMSGQEERPAPPLAPPTKAPPIEEKPAEAPPPKPTLPPNESIYEDDRPRVDLKES